MKTLTRWALGMGIIGSLCTFTREAAALPGFTAVTMPTMPPTRTWCVFDPVKSGKPDPARASLTVEWDPVRPGSLTRYVVTREEYLVSCYSEPKYHPIEVREFHWRFPASKTFGAEDPNADPNQIAPVRIDATVPVPGSTTPTTAQVNIVSVGATGPGVKAAAQGEAPAPLARSLPSVTPTS